MTLCIIERFEISPQSRPVSRIM